MASSLTTVDLTNCDREPIHLSGAVQPYGVLFAIDPHDYTIVAASENVATLVGISAHALLGHALDEIVSGSNLDAIRAAAGGADVADANPIAMTVRTPGGDRSVDAVLHRSGALIVLEIEPIDLANQAPPHFFHRAMRGSIDAFVAVRTVADLCELGAREIARLTGFDRVMIYRFDAEWNGEVVAEQRAAEMPPYLGLHYPASDIPRQAREIFRRNWLRFIPDVNYTAVPIVPATLPSGEPLDLTRAMLRSVSPMHVEYLQNMAVAATLTITLLRNGELWGLIACHHRTPKMISYELRLACEIIGRSMSLHLGTLEENEDTSYRMKLKAGQVRLFEAMSGASDIWDALAAAGTDLLSLVGATGAAIRFGDDCRLIGQTPGLADVMAVTDWLAANTSSDLFVTESLPTVDARFVPLAQTACGVVALALSRAKRSFVLWFRPEMLVTVDWGGNPAKISATVADQTRLSPRKSFEIWSEIVRLHSRSWTISEIEAAREWSRFVGALIVDRAEELERANRELALANVELASLLRSNVELDAFAHIASHDLKEPLRGIHNYATFLIEDYGTVVGADGRDKLETLVRLSRRMELLIESLLALSSIGRADFDASPTELRRVIDETIEIYGPRIAQCRGSVSIVTPLPTVYVDSSRLGQVFQNLISNALKYSMRAPQIEIGIAAGATPPPNLSEESGAVPTLGTFATVFVRDNGIGIRQKHLSAVFQMFKRLHGTDLYGGGTGAGLAIAKKIIERHGGNMWAESTFGDGTTFYFTLPTERRCNVEF
jgi:light-regulated signal transduction histidine kinase (bacteriophytochrome)